MGDLRGGLCMEKCLMIQLMKIQAKLVRDMWRRTKTAYQGKHTNQVLVHLRREGLGAKTIKKNTNLTPNKRQTYRAKQYKVTSFLSTDYELSTNPCLKNVYSLGPRRGRSRLK